MILKRSKADDREAGGDNGKAALFGCHSILDNGRSISHMQEEKMSTSLCRVCKHFIRRTRGKRGGLKGYCEKSAAECQDFVRYGWRRPPRNRVKCARFEEETKND